MTRMEDDTFLIVTGTGRSGTSAVARVLHESGVSMGTSFAPPSEHNRLGFYEDLAARDINNRLMADVGLGDLRLASALPSREAVGAAARPYADEMQAVASSGARGWKDPQFCFTLEAWLPALAVKPKVVVCLRSPEAYVESVLAIAGLLERETAELWWQRHLSRLLEVIETRGLDAHCVEYDAFAFNPGATVAALARFAGHELDASYVEPSLRSHAGEVPERHRALYERVVALGTSRAG